jgi:cytochrome c-type biogenesis protein CcmH/NrfG
MPRPQRTTRPQPGRWSEKGIRNELRQIQLDLRKFKFSAADVMYLHRRIAELQSELKQVVIGRLEAKQAEAKKSPRKRQRTRRHSVPRAPRPPRLVAATSASYKMRCLYSAV